MVGHIETGKTKGDRRTGAKPEIKAIPNNPGETIDMDLAVKQSALEWPETINATPIPCFPARDAAQEPEAGNPVVRLQCAARNDAACMAERKVRAHRQGIKTL